MIKYSLHAEKVTKRFGRRLIFREISFNWNEHGVYGIAGPNGSGKSTLVKIIAGIIPPHSGKIIHKTEKEILKPEELHKHIGFVSPYLFLYDEFTALENIEHTCNIRGNTIDKEYLDSLFEKFSLPDRKDDLVKGFSSGMKQRLKYIFALVHKPSLLILDEPTSNLDAEGKEKVYATIKDYGKEHHVIVATNEENELTLCREIVSVVEYKTQEPKKIRLRKKKTTAK